MIWLSSLGFNRQTTSKPSIEVWSFPANSRFRSYQAAGIHFCTRRASAGSQSRRWEISTQKWSLRYKAKRSSAKPKKKSWQPSRAPILPQKRRFRNSSSNIHQSSIMQERRKACWFTASSCDSIRCSTIKRYLQWRHPRASKHSRTMRRPSLTMKSWRSIKTNLSTLSWHSQIERASEKSAPSRTNFRGGQCSWTTSPGSASHQSLITKRSQSFEDVQCGILWDREKSLLEETQTTLWLTSISRLREPHTKSRENKEPSSFEATATSSSSTKASDPFSSTELQLSKETKRNWTTTTSLRWAQNFVNESRKILKSKSFPDLRLALHLLGELRLDSSDPKWVSQTRHTIKLNLDFGLILKSFTDKNENIKENLDETKSWKFLMRRLLNRIVQWHLTNSITCQTLLFGVFSQLHQSCWNFVSTFSCSNGVHLFMDKLNWNFIMTQDKRALGCFTNICFLFYSNIENKTLKVLWMSLFWRLVDALTLSVVEELTCLITFALSLSATVVCSASAVEVIDSFLRSLARWNTAWARAGCWIVCPHDVWAHHGTVFIRFKVLEWVKIARDFVVVQQEFICLFLTINGVQVLRVALDVGEEIFDSFIDEVTVKIMKMLSQESAPLIKSNLHVVVEGLASVIVGIEFLDSIAEGWELVWNAWQFIQVWNDDAFTFSFVQSLVVGGWAC